MGNHWYGISTDYLLSSELALLRRGGLNPSIDVKVMDVCLDQCCSNEAVQESSFNQGRIEREHPISVKSENYIHCLEIDLNTNLNGLSEDNKYDN